MNLPPLPVYCHFHSLCEFSVFSTMSHIGAIPVKFSPGKRNKAVRGCFLVSLHNCHNDVTKWYSWCTLNTSSSIRYKCKTKSNSFYTQLMKAGRSKILPFNWWGRFLLLADIYIWMLNSCQWSKSLCYHWRNVFYCFVNFWHDVLLWQWLLVSTWSLHDSSNTKDVRETVFVLTGSITE